MKRFQFMFFLVTIFIATMETSLSAAPIGVPGATAGSKAMTGAATRSATLGPFPASTITNSPGQATIAVRRCWRR